VTNPLTAGSPSYGRVNRQYVAMSTDQVWEFVNSRDLMIVTFVRDDGYPHATPVWFCTVDRRVYFRGSSRKVKFRFADEAHACCVWESGRRYLELKGVVMWGTTRIVTSPSLVSTVGQVIEDKYSDQIWKPSEVPKDWVAWKNTDSMTLVEFSPGRVSSWDNSKLDGWTLDR